jgi:hypothetical protein
MARRFDPFGDKQDMLKTGGRNPGLTPVFKDGSLLMRHF